MLAWSYTHFDKGCRIAQTSDVRSWLQYGSRKRQCHRTQDLAAAARGGHVSRTMVSDLAAQVMSAVPDANTLSTLRRRVSYTQERHQFHVYVNDGITFLCVAEEVRADVLSHPSHSSVQC